MKAIPWVTVALASSLLTLAGCKKAEPSVGAAPEYYGVKVDWPQLDSAFANVSPELQNQVSRVKHAFRYAQFPQAVAELNKLAKYPNLTEPQKKLVNDLLEQTKQVIAKAPPP